MSRASRSIPDDAFVLVIGAMKSGTTTFFAHLTSHPAIAGSRVNEPEYFSEHQGHGVEVASYEDLWDYDPGLHRYCAEASTGYTKYPHELRVPDRMVQSGIDPKFIYLVRHPLDRMESQFNHGLIRQRPWAYDDFREPELLDLSRYYMQLQQYLLRFPDRERYRIVDFDDLIAEPDRVMEGTFDWLGLDPIGIEEDRHENRTPEPSKLELMLDGIDLSVPLAVVPDTLKESLKNALRTVSPAKRKMTQTESERARAYLRHDLQLFGEEFGFPVGKWGFG